MSEVNITMTAKEATEKFGRPLVTEEMSLIFAFIDRREKELMIQSNKPYDTNYMVSKELNMLAHDLAMGRHHG